MKIIKSATLNSLDAIDVDVEITFTKGMPSFSIVGLASSSIQESKDRVKSALLTNDFKFPPKKITVNLSPSDINKSGTHFDLAIALLISTYEKKYDYNDFYLFAELGLDGKLKDSFQIFPLILSLAKAKNKLRVLVSKESAEKISLIPNVECYAVDNLVEAIDFFNEKDKSQYLIKSKKNLGERILLNEKEFFYENIYKQDFKDVKGQKHAIKASLIAAAGFHNILLKGSPGVGKSMIIKRLQYILPPMSKEEILEKVKLSSLEDNIVDFNSIRVFRSPHHSSTKASIFGGGTINSKIGEVALANGGVLFFDELPHFAKSILEALREPLEDYKILISRVNSKTVYETKFLFASAMNPCPCGNLLSSKNECRCSEVEIQRYNGRLSDPLLDRIDMIVIMNDTNFSDESYESSSILHNKVIKAFSMQINRGQKNLNGKLDDDEIEKYCILNSEAKTILEKAIENFALSFRAINKVLKVARTIADLSESENIEKVHILEALSYRNR